MTSKIPKQKEDKEQGNNQPAALHRLLHMRVQKEIHWNNNVLFMELRSACGIK